MTPNVSFPAEWYPQSGIQLTWPHPNTDWAYMLDEVTDCYKKLASEISQREKLIIVTPCPDEVKKQLQDMSHQRYMGTRSRRYHGIQRRSSRYIRLQIQRLGT